MGGYLIFAILRMGEYGETEVESNISRQKGGYYKMYAVQ